MTAFGHSMKSIPFRLLDLLVKLRFPLIGILVVGIGVLLGQSMRSPDQAELLVSILATLALLLITLHKPLNGILLWLFFMPFLETWVKIPMGAGVPDLSFSRFAIAFLGIAMLAQGAIGKLRIARMGLTEVCIVATTIGIMIAAPLSVTPNPKGVIQTAIALYFTPLVVYFFAKNLVKSRRQLDRVLMTIAILGFVSGAYAAYEHATGNVLFLSKGTSVEDLALYREALGIRMIRGIYGSTGKMGRILAFVIPITLYLFLESKGHRARRAFLTVMLTAQFYGLVVAMSRTPWYALLIALFVMQFFYPRFRKMFLVILVLAAIVLAFTWDQVGQSDIAARVGDENSTYEGRQGRWQAGFAMWKARPVRGWGFGRYEQESGRFRTDGSRKDLSAVENDYLYILVGSGLLGFVPYLLVLLAPLINSLRLFFAVRSARARSPGWPGFVKAETIAAYWAAMLCFAITSFTATQGSPIPRLLAFAVAGAVVGSHEYLLPGFRTLAQQQKGALGTRRERRHTSSKPHICSTGRLKR